jgi:hypothetical protein
MAANVGYVIAAYLVTALALGGYTLSLLSRARTPSAGRTRSPIGAGGRSVSARGRAWTVTESVAAVLTTI